MPPTTDFPRPEKLAHVVLRSGRYEETLQWWKTVLGAHEVHANPVVSFLTYDDEHHRLAVINLGEAEPAPPGHAGMEHVAFSYADLPALVDTYERLAAEGIEPYWCINHGMTLSMYYRDPDDHQVELQVDLCSPDEADEFMNGPEFAANPIGIEYDPAHLLRQFRAGETPDALAVYGPRSADA